jgi:ethanolamine-phosphate phospho-lyase
MESSLSLFVGAAVLGTLISKSNIGGEKPQPLTHHEKHMLAKAHITDKGSFLLKTPKDISDAAKHASKLGVVDTDAKNDVIGRELIAKREKSMGPNVSVFYKQDGGLVVVGGEGAHMIDIDSNRHLDCCNNVACCGHAHPAVVKAGQDELAKVQTNGRFLNPVQQRYVEKLLATFPPELNTIYFVNSGSEANDLALRIAREHTTASRPKDVIVLDSAYHGHTQSLVDISPYKWYQAVDGNNYQPPTTHVVSCPDGYRGRFPFGQTDYCAKVYAAEVEEVVNSPEGGVGTFIAESIVGCGGQIEPPPGYLQRCYEAVRRQGGVCIADEVQTGFARTGTHFWMFQKHGVVPDIVTVGKPMGNGYPVAAVICRREVANSFAKTGIEYFNTYGGNSVACAIAEAVLDTIVAENLQENARIVGDYLTTRLNTLVGKYKWVGDVRGSGLFQGIEFVKDAQAKPLEAHPDLTKFIVDFLKYQRVIISRDGPDENVIKVKPPLVFSKEDVDTLVNAMDRALTSAVDLGIF